MGKRSSAFAPRKNDAYDTPREALLPLLPFLPPATRFVEPCAGKGDLLAYLQDEGHQCTGAFDIEPREPRYRLDSNFMPTGNIIKRDALTFRADKHHYPVDMIITNPPWTREILHALIMHFYWQRPTWFLFDADWKHTEQAQPYLPMIKKTVSVGRVRWIEGTKDKSNDNCEWYFMDSSQHTIEFHRKAWT